ncbi:MAG: hypothetical protein HQM14_00615 [SAR324 cluster bacterium]|nr:hypothetical protein [SAR324 cluster bacterium]
MISLTPNAVSLPIEISEDQYHQLVQQKQYGWSVCQSKNEWLAKLHYLRQGRNEGKIDEHTFREKEKNLILNWWRRHL